MIVSAALGGGITFMWKIFNQISAIRNELSPLEGKSLRETVEDIDDRVRGLEDKHQDLERRRSQHWILRLLGE